MRDAGLGSGRRTPGSGSQGVPGDVWGVIQHWHIEVKRQEKWSLPAWIKQAEQDSQGKPWFIPFRRNRSPWYVALRLEDLIELLKLEEK